MKRRAALWVAACPPQAGFNRDINSLLCFFFLFARPLRDVFRFIRRATHPPTHRRSLVTFHLSLLPTP
jgi:hypothetical protein